MSTLALCAAVDIHCDHLCEKIVYSPQIEPTSSNGAVSIYLQVG